MQTVKIVSQLKDKTDSVSFYSGAHNVIVRRGVWITVEGKGLCVKVNGQPEPSDKIIFKKDQQPDAGAPAKLILLERVNSFLSIGTDAEMYLLGDRGQTIEAFY